MEGVMGKYHALGEFLRQQPANEVRMSFAQIERVIGAKLPPSAHDHRAWWSNNPSNSVMTKAWLEAGFESEQVDMEGRKLVFRRAAKAQPVQSHHSIARLSTASSRHPLFGWLKGTVRVAPGVDLTEPADPEWADNIGK